MQRRLLAVVLVVTLLVAGTTLFVLGSGSGSDRADGSFPTATSPATDAGTDTTTPANGTATPANGTATPANGTATPPTAPSFAFSIDRIEQCGRTCRDVTSTLENGGAAATDVTVHTRIFVGDGTDGHVVWRGQERVGSLDGGESYTATKRVDLTIADAIAIESAGGWITVQTTVQSAERTVTFTRRRQVG